MGLSKKQLSKTEKKVIIIMAVAVVLATAIFAWQLYANDYYRASDTAKEALKGNTEVEVVETEGYYLFDPVEDTEKGIVFYPGGKVEETAYAPLLLELTEAGYEVYLIKMPAKLAIFGMNAAEGVFKEAPHIKEWTLMGHSLGGAMAASFSADHDETISALVLLAAYSTEDLNGLDIDVYSFYGTEDEVLNMEKYKEYYSNLPKDLTEAVIDGGNHANYAYYGAQKGDGEATISREEQIQSVLDIFLNSDK